MNLQQATDCAMNCAIHINSINSQSADCCSICLDDIDLNKNKLITECGHIFHTSCLLKNASINGFQCPMCRTVLVEEPEDDDDDDDEAEDDELYTEYALRGMRFLFQQASGQEIVEADEDYDEYETIDDDETENNIVVPTFEHIIEQLRINNVSMEDVVKTLVSENYDGYSQNEFANDDMFSLLDRIVIDYVPAPLPAAPALLDITVDPILPIQTTNTISIGVDKEMPCVIIEDSIIKKQYRVIQSQFRLVASKPMTSFNHNEVVGNWFL